MPISVTTSETTETYTTWVNGRPIERSETVNIYVIEPDSRSAFEERVKNGMHRTRLATVNKPEERSIGRERAWMAIWIVWAAYLFCEYSRKT